jgi:uncharacterized repeat protein (TIGR01451 family)
MNGLSARRMAPWALLGLALCGCNAVPARQALDEALAVGPAATFETEAFAPCNGGACTLNAGADAALAGAEPPPLPYCVTGAWKPPGIAGTWPPGEYLCDGGDRQPAAQVDENAQVEGLDVEDTIAHYDTISCGRKVQPSNRVCLYAPRFGAVRKVIHPLLNEQVDTPGGIEQPVALVRYDERQEATATLQNVPPQVGIARRKAAGILSSSWADVATQLIAPEEVQDLLAPYANLSVIRTGLYQQSEKPYLAQGIEAAITWTPVQGVEVLVGQQAANEVVGDQRAEAVYTIRNIPGCPMLRVIKVASTQTANPGDTVDFTIRFDNVGTEELANVTILDNLTTRLEYVLDSAQASVKAEFATQPNQAGSLVLRWQIADPIKPGDGGVVRFTCRVR